MGLFLFARGCTLTAQIKIISLSLSLTLSSLSQTYSYMLPTDMHSSTQVHVRMLQVPPLTLIKCNLQRVTPFKIPTHLINWPSQESSCQRYMYIYMYNGTMYIPHWKPRVPFRESTNTQMDYFTITLHYRRRTRLYTVPPSCLMWCK